MSLCVYIRMINAIVLEKLQRMLGTWNFESKSGDTGYEAHMFPLLVKEQLEFWPEKDVRQRIWVRYATFVSPPYITCLFFV